jgi:mycofactocin biosynthetic radical S-adenosylmethionine protein MftC
MAHDEVVLRKESFGGIIGRRNGYGFNVVNTAGYDLLTDPRAASPKHPQRDIDLFHAQLQDYGFLDRDTRFRGRTIDNKNTVAHLSAPIRVWLEVTGICNLACGECFNHNHKDFATELSLDAITNALTDLYDSGVLQLTITGGEPLIRKDIWSILDHAFGLGFAVRFFTNGTTLNEKNAQRLSEYPISHIFASMDGVGDDNDLLRGVGTFPRIAKGIEALTRRSSVVTLSVTLHAYSIRNLHQTFDLAKANGIQSLLIRPLLEYNKKQNPVAILPKELPRFLAELEAQSVRTGVEYQLNKLPFFQNEKAVFIHDRKSDIHFSHFTTHNQFGCVGGNTVVGIKSNGAIMACGFVDHPYISAGENIGPRKFLDLWNNSPNVKVLRDRPGNPTCRSCHLLSVCGGGCRANADLHNGSLDAVDPYCFLGYPGLTPERTMVSEAVSLNGRSAPSVSARTIVTKCGSGSLL